MYDGTNLVFFNGSVYFHRAGTPKIARFELGTRHYSEIVIHEKAAHKGDHVSMIRNSK